MRNLIVNCKTGIAEMVEVDAAEVAAREAEIAAAIAAYMEEVAAIEAEERAAKVFTVPIVAPDFIVASPVVKDDPLEALAEAVAEAGRAHGESKSIALITLSLTKYLQDVEQRLKKAKV